MAKNNKMYSLTKFRSSEELLKQKILSDPDIMSYGPLTNERFQKIYSDVPLDLEGENISGSLSEESYFQTRVDVSAVMHLRYLPPIYHVSEFFEIDCVLKGDITSYIGNQCINLTSGDIMILAPGTNHAACTYDDDTVMINLLVRRSTFESRFWGILPENDLFKTFFEKSLYGNTDTPFLLFRTNAPQFVSECILPILEEYRSNNRYKTTMLSSLLSIFFIRLLRSYEKNLEVPSLNSKSLGENIVFILEYMQKNYSTITLSHLASFFNYSERQMQRIIESATGAGFGDNVKKLRMNKAAELLKNTNMTVAEIADSLGYYDASSFRQSFKKYYGCSPKDYKSIT